MCAPLFRLTGSSMRVLSCALLVAAALPARADEAAKAELPPEESFVRTAHAARWTGPIQLDGKMDEPGWQAAPLEETFTQAAPDEGKPATNRTAFRVLWDDEYLYFGAVCEDSEPPTATLSRRDRFIEGDSIQFDLDTTWDRRTAYHFQVFAAGQQLDGIHYNDTSMTTDWDAAWDSAVARTPKGWSVEMRIPLRVMRIPEKAHVFGFNVYRILSRRHEEDQWRYRPNGRPGDVSRFGLLEGIDGIHPVRALELRPYVGARVSRAVPAPGDAVPKPELNSLCGVVGFDPRHNGGACVGLDLRYSLASDLLLVGTLNPDFGQVEADQRVLNLSTFETFFPEKRPFFLEGMDIFQPALNVDFGGPYGGNLYQIFYSRRIGRSPPGPDLADDQKLVFLAPSVPVLGALKLTGTIGGASVGLLSAAEPRVNAQIREGDGSVSDARMVEARQTEALRIRKPLGDTALLGFTATGVDPFFTDASLGLDRTHSHVGEADFTLYSGDRAWNFTAQGVGSALSSDDPHTLRDGTSVGSSSTGAAGSARLGHTSEHTIFAVNADYLTPRLNLNGLGFMQRANLARGMGYFALRDPHPGPLWQNAQVIAGAREIHDASLDVLIERDALVEAWVNTNDFWFIDTGAIVQGRYADDRELEDGTPLERQPSWAWYGFISTDSRKRLQAQFSWTEARSWPLFERQNQLEGTLVFRPMPQLDGTFDVTYGENAGTLRQIRTAGPVAGEGGGNPEDTFSRDVATLQRREYLLAAQQARFISATLRATYAFTPYLTLQAYAQYFTAGISYTNLQKALADPGKAEVKLASLLPVTDADRAPNSNDRQAGLNVNVILRWEWRTGSTLYLVYAHQSSVDFTPPSRGLDFNSELNALGRNDVAHGDTFLVKVDLLSAL